MSEPSRFRPARSPGWVIWAAQVLNRLDLAWRNRLRIEPRDLEVLRGLPAGAGRHPRLESRRRDGHEGLPGALAPMRTQVPVHDESRGVRRGLRQCRLVAPAPRRLLRGTRGPERGGETLRHRRGEAGTGGARRLPGRGDLLPERPGPAVQERRRRHRDAGRRRGTPDPAGLDSLPGTDGHQVPISPTHRSPAGAADASDGTASLPAHPRRLAPATIGSHHGGAPASGGGGPSSEARPGSSRPDERPGSRSPAAGPLRRWRDTTRATPPTPVPRRWTGRGGSAPTCGAC